MKLASILGALLSAVVAVALFAPVSRASERDQLTRLTFSKAFRIPGHKDLPAGTYWFKVLDGNFTPNVIQIFNANRTQLDATLSTRPAYRASVTGRTQLAVANGNAKHPEALMEWFYPGKYYGHALEYSPRAMRQLREAGVREVVATRG